MAEIKLNTEVQDPTSLGADEDGTAYYYVSYDGYSERGCCTTVRLCRADDEHWIVPVE